MRLICVSVANQGQTHPLDPQDIANNKLNGNRASNARLTQIVRWFVLPFIEGFMGMLGTEWEN